MLFSSGDLGAEGEGLLECPASWGGQYGAVRFEFVCGGLELGLHVMPRWHPQVQCPHQLRCRVQVPHLCPRSLKSDKARHICKPPSPSLTQAHTHTPQHAQPCKHTWEHNPSEYRACNSEGVGTEVPKGELRSLDRVPQSPAALQGKTDVFPRCPDMTLPGTRRWRYNRRTLQYHWSARGLCGAVCDNRLYICTYILWVIQGTVPGL